MKRTGISVVATVWTVLVLGGPAWSYTERPVTDGGAIAGVVKLNGEKPAPKAYNLITFPNPVYCGQISTGSGWRLLDEFRVGEEGGLKNVVVMLEGVTEGKPFDDRPAPTIEARDCRFAPPVVVVREEEEIEVVNMDPIMHDVQAYETAPFGSEIMFHRPLRLNPFHQWGTGNDHDHRPGEPLVNPVSFSKGRRLFYLECGFHEYMQIWGISVSNPYYTITDEQGRFTIADIPEGVYRIVAWHPGMRGILATQVAVLADDTLDVRFEFEAPSTYRSAHTSMVENPHYNMNAMGPLEIRPTHEQQTP